MNFVDSAVQTSTVPTDGPILLLMLNMMENLTTTGVVSWDSVDIIHYVLEVCLFVRNHHRHFSVLVVCWSHVSDFFPAKGSTIWNNLPDSLI